MVTEQLSELMRDLPTSRSDGPDLDRIRRLGRRQRVRSRAAVGAGALVVVGLLGGVWWALPSGGDASTVVPATSRDHVVTGISAYEQRVLDELPGSYAVDGTVVLVDRIPVDAENLTAPGARIVGTPVPLGFHGSVGPGYLQSHKRHPAFQDNAPRGSQLVIDPGPQFLGCEVSGGNDTCQPTVFVRDTAGSFRFLHGLGSEHFLQPGAEMQLFTDDDFSDREWRQTLIGGFHGDTTSRVVLDLVDGTEVEASVDTTMSAGDTLFWATLPVALSKVRAYDAAGDLVAEHVLRKCSDPVDCEVR